jgi:3-hydroxyacyl-CoA dehydrogenase/3a,7a,12a-trihydroxy-5b-cholest-24-enoyl-CoA hydratase
MGGGRNGEGKRKSDEERVVEEIKRKGGKDVEKYDYVVNGDRIIQKALEKFGRVDVVVNNDGIMSEK